MDQQLLDPDALLEGMRHKGAFGLLYSGVWGYPINDKELVSSKRVIKNYLGPLDLPLQLMTKVTLDSASPGAPGEVLVTRTGTLDTLDWDEQVFRRIPARPCHRLAAGCHAAPPSGGSGSLCERHSPHPRH
jgi:hypothetical protein